MKKIIQIKKNRNSVKKAKGILFFILCFCFVVISSFAQEQHIIVTVTNPLNLDRSNEMISLSWNKIKELMPGLDVSKVCVFNAQTKDTLVIQSIDEKQNKSPEELIFLSNFEAKEIKKFIVKAIDRAPGIVKPLTDVRFMLPREDIAWENDRIAHRIYGPALAKEVNNGIDVWTKRVRYLIVEKWYKGDETAGVDRISYHEDHGEGADFFDVGRSLGAGSCALYQDDSLYQPGVFTNYKILATGPIRAMFEVTYNSVQFDRKSISEVKRITLDAGTNLNKIEVMYKYDSSNAVLPFAAGIVKRKDVTSFIDKESRWVSLWGQTNEKEENGSLGTGIVMPKESFKGIKEDKNHILILGNVELNKAATYYAGAGWTRSGDFHNAEEWNSYLKEFAQRLESPLKIRIAIKE